ncbi:MAG: VOC family protein [Candidatus Eremiobacteraeota bacterium]|nr:VOC family protein [Candidatus Eremiobacteraeota bacterium]
MQLEPYVFFYGRCEEALKFYKNALGGSYEISLVKDSPMAAEMGPGSGDRVMHAKFSAPGVAFMASDGRENKAVDSDAGNISLSLGTDDASEGERVFKALSEGGTVSMPLSPAFWGGTFGMLVDRFGIEWMMTLP